MFFSFRKSSKSSETQPLSTKGEGVKKEDSCSSASATSREGIFSKFAERLKRTSTLLTDKVSSVFMGGKKLDDEVLKSLRNLLIESDLGVTSADRIIGHLSTLRLGTVVSHSDIQELLKKELVDILNPVEVDFTIPEDKKPFVVLMVGVNGSGKTTTLGKLSAYFHRQGLSVMMAAGDTFRAAAVEQLIIWGQRTGAEVVSGKPGGDPAGLAFEAVKRAREEKKDLLLIDTAGRLQNKAGLMAELEKIIRVIRKQDESAPHAVLLTLDATVGQDALKQVEIFSQVACVTGLIMTKLDGTARGGVLVSLASRFGLPVHFIGLGEKEEDLYSFSAEAFAHALVTPSESILK